MSSQVYVEMTVSRTTICTQFKCSTDCGIYAQRNANKKKTFSVENKSTLGSDGSITALRLFLLFAHSVHEQYY